MSQPAPKAPPSGAVDDRDDVALSAGLMVAGSAFFVVLAACVKAASAEATPMQAVLYRSLFTIPPLAAVMGWQRVSPVSARWRLLLLRGSFGFAALFCYFWAVAHIRLADVLALQQLSPVFVALLSVLLLGERPGRTHWILVGVCLVGALLVVQPTRGAASLDSLAAVLSAIFSAVAYVSVRALTRTEPPTRIVLWFSAVAVTFALPFVVPGWHWLSLRGNLLLIASGLLAAPAQGLMTAAYRHAPAHITAVFSYSNVPFAYLVGLWVWGERHDALANVGIALVVLGGALLVGTLRARNGRTPRDGA